MISAKRIRRPTAVAGAEEDAEPLLVCRQRAAGQRDHDGVVAGEQDVDPDDLENGDEELAAEVVHAPRLPETAREAR